LRVYPVYEDVEDGGIHVGELERESLHTCGRPRQRVAKDFLDASRVVGEEGGVDEVFLAQGANFGGYDALLSLAGDGAGYVVSRCFFIE
jgi:hypothetical protein